MAVLVAVVGLAPRDASPAAGPAVVSVIVTIVNPATNQVITQVDPATMPQYSVNVAYSCNIADCTGVTVKLAGTPTDPTYGVHRKESGFTYTPPFAGAPTPTGTAAAGITISLGNVTAGTGGSFRINYTLDTGRDRVSNASFFPAGSLIQPQVTISATNADNEGTGTATATWTNVIPNPTLSLSRSVASTRTDLPVTVTVTEAVRCYRVDVGGHMNGVPSLLCAASNQAVVQLPVNATYVLGSGGAYDSGAHTVTFANSGDGAAATGVSGSFKVTFSSDAYPTSGADCVADESLTATGSTTFIDGTVKSDTQKTVSVQVQNCAPFADATMDDKGVSRTAGTAANPIIDIPYPGTPNYSGYWVVTARNRANVEGVATITESDLNQPDLPVTMVDVSAGPPGTIQYTLDDGTTGSSTARVYTAPTGRRIVAATVISGVLAGPNATDAGSANTPFQVRFWFTVTSDATPGTRSNTASAVMRYPDYPELDDVPLGPTSKSVLLEPGDPPATTPPSLVIRTGNPTTVGNVTPVVGAEVKWTLWTSVGNAPNTNSIIPQYVFVAPEFWDVTGATFNTEPPAGYQKEFTTVTVAGKTRNAVVVTWPGPISIGASGSSGTLPTMTVTTKPTGQAPAGTNNNVANSYFGDAANSTANTVYDPAAYVDAADLDGDGSTTETYATQSRAASLAPTLKPGVTKEICRPNPSAPDGCDWIANSSIKVGVAPNATSIKYRVTIRNEGNAALNNVFAYDVLPYLGDTGTSTATASTPRGSDVQEVVSSVSDVGAGLTLSYSNSTNPSRPQVYSGATDPADWDSTFTGASAIRAQIATLPAFESRSFTYQAALVGAAADKTACNSVAVIADATAALEPAAVCATTQEADFSIDVLDRFPLQEGRVGIVPFVVNNGGGSASASGTVTIDVPAGVSIVNLSSITGWSCSAPSMTGPVTVTCVPVNGDGTTRSLVLNTPETILLRVRPADGAASSLCFDGAVSGLMYDPDLMNNEKSGCSTLFGGDVLLDVQKSDGVSVAKPGQLLTYTVTLSNRLVAEGLTGAALMDRLPGNVVFVSASDSGVLSGVDVDGRGGVVTWPTVDLAAAGAANADGSNGTGAAGSSVTRTITVQVVAQATGDVVNLAEGRAADPTDPQTQLSDTDIDTDQLQRSSVTKSSNAPAAGVRAGDEVTYTVTLTNDGTADYTAGNPATLVDDLTAVLDDATFVAGSATATVGGSTTGLPDPGADKLLRWSGPLLVDSTVTVTYRVKAGNGTTGDRVLTNTALAATQPGACSDGLDANGISCATVSVSFAPVLAKTVASSEQNDDGTWTIVYELTVTNLNPSEAATYDLSDALAFGSGIDVVSASVTGQPSGVTPLAWSGSGAIAEDVTIAADAQQTYEVTVVADAHTTPGTPAARCLDGLAGGFANRGTLTSSDGRTSADEACASPVAPQVLKAAAPSMQLPDGTWSTTYTVTVRNTNLAPATLAYTLDDLLTVPAGLTVVDVAVDGPAGAPVNAAFDGTSDTALLTGADRIDAASMTTPATRVYTITLVTDAPAGAAGPSDLACPAAGTGGYANVVTLYAGTSTTALDDASACASALTQPEPVVSKRVVSSSINTDGIWTLTYEIEVTNPSATYSTRYSLADELDFAAGVLVLDADVASADAPPAVTWDGAANKTVVTNQPLAAGATHTYTVVVSADPGTTDPESAAADCRIDSGETGTGYRNIATVASGATSSFADACEPITDPSVVKTRVGEPTQDPLTGEWTLQYKITVSNRSTTTSGTIPYTLTDELGFPADVEIVDVATAGPAGATTNAEFNGSTEAELGSGAIGAAVDETTPATQVFTVTVRFRIPAGLEDVAPCDPQQGPGGLRNGVEIVVGQRVSGAVACADVPEVPLPGLQKTVLSQEQQADGTWRVLYEIIVANPSSSTASTYTLDDSFGLGDGIVMDQPAAVVGQPAGVAVNPDWNGESDTALADEIVLPGGGTHTYTVRAVIDAGAVQGTDPDGNCMLEDGEESTGFGNTATLDTGVASRDSSACATAFDPPVTKQVDGEPVQQPDGSWLVTYTMTVTNPSPTVALRYGLVDELNFPDGTTITVESASGRPGSPAVQADWNGTTQTRLVADGTLLAANAIHVFDVTVRAMLPADQQSSEGGWANLARVESSVDGVVTSEATAAADIRLPELTVDKAVTADPILRIGDQVQYQITIENVGLGDFTDLYPAVVWDDLSDVLDDGEVTVPPAVDPEIGEIVSSDSGFHWRGALPSEGQVTITYTVTVGEGGDADLYNVAFGAEPLAETPEAPAEEECTEAATCASTANAMPTLMIEKSVDQQAAMPGDVVQYTVSVTNTGSVALTDDEPAAINDDLSAVLDNATYQGDAAADAGTVAVSGTSLTWSGPLAVDATATITYSVRVNDSAVAGAMLDNVAAVDSTLAVMALDGSAADRSVGTSTAIEALPPAPADPPADTPPGKLPKTGMMVDDILVVGLGLALCGTGLVILGRKRRPRSPGGSA